MTSCDIYIIVYLKRGKKRMIHIISDSSTLYSIESAKKKGLSIVPLNISVDSQTYRDFEDITSTQLLTMIEEHKVPKTSQPSLGEKIDLYNNIGQLVSSFTNTSFIDLSKYPTGLYILRIQLPNSTFIRKILKE